MPLLQTPLKKNEIPKSKTGKSFEGGDQKSTSYTSDTSDRDRDRDRPLRIYKASWTGAPEVWACRYCGLKGDKQSMMEKHDCPEIKRGGG